jgi:hypothetical protein
MRIQTFLTTACLALLGTIAFAQNVTYDFDKGTNFSKFRTYAWVQGTNLIDPLNHKRIVSAVDAQLESKGLTKVEMGAKPDAFVAYHASLDTNLQVKGFAKGFGAYRFAENRSAAAPTEELLIGTLVVDMMHAKTKTIVWRATAVKELDSYASAETREKNINSAAEKLFRNYPPTK